MLETYGRQGCVAGYVVSYARRGSMAWLRFGSPLTHKFSRHPALHIPSILAKALPPLAFTNFPLHPPSRCAVMQIWGCCGWQGPDCVRRCPDASLFRFAPWKSGACYRDPGVPDCVCRSRDSSSPLTAWPGRAAGGTCATSPFGSRILH